MTIVRRDIWSLSTSDNPWHPNVLAYARAVRAMQQLPETDPRSWAYQAAIHGRAGVRPPRGAPWNECQHATWFFLPWHRMYLFQFEQIVKSFVASNRGPDDWALPYWNYSRGAPGNALPPAFRQRSLPDDSPNPLFVSQRRSNVNSGRPVSAIVVDTSSAMATRFFTSNDAATGFGGPQTGWAHQGPAFGALEASPHGPVHVYVGGSFGLMTDPDTAALDPIFWLHHANIDRLWEQWLLARRQNTNPTVAAWLNRRFPLRNANGSAVEMRVRDVLDTVARLDYTYDDLPSNLAADEGDGGEAGQRVTRRKKPVMVGRNEEGVQVVPSGASVNVSVGELPEPSRAAAARGEPTRLYLNLADIEGEKNPGVVFGVYVNLPADASVEERGEYLAGVVSFFGIEQAGTAASAAETSGRRAPHPLRYSFDITDLADQLRAKGDWDPQTMRVDLLPVEGTEEEEAAAAAAFPPVRVGTISLHAG